MRGDTVSLEGFVRVLFSHRRVIIFCVVSCILIGVISNVILPQRWIANASIVIIPPRIKAIFSPDDSFVVTQDERLNIPIETHLSLLKSSFVLKKVVDRLNLTSQNVPISLEKLHRSLRVKFPQGIVPTDVALRRTAQANVLVLEVQWSDPQQAITIANVWAEEYIQYIQRLIDGEIYDAGNFVAMQFETAKQKLNDAEKQYLEYMAASQPELLKAELELKKQKMVDFTRELQDLNIAIRTQQDTLTELERQIETQEKFVVLSKAITDDALWQLESKGGEIPQSVASRRLRSEEKNPVFFELAKRIADARVELGSMRARFNYVSEQSSKTLKEIGQLSREISRVQLHVDQLSRAKEVAASMYHALAGKMKEASLVNLLTFGEVRLASLAMSSQKRAMLNTGIILLFAAILGVFVGIFGAFVMQFIEDNAHLFGRQHQR